MRPTQLLTLAAFTLVAQAHSAPIDRHALVARHTIELTSFDGERPLQVGNGEFAFGMDVTGLQTFAPFNTMAHWGWHSDPLPKGLRISDFHGQVWDTHGRPVRYPMPDPDQPELSAWLAANPHRTNLGRIGLVLSKKDGTPATSSDLHNIHQTLDIWTGLVTSRFEVEDQPVTVITACHPSVDQIAAHVSSPLIQTGHLSVFLECPGDDATQFPNFVGFGHPAQFEVRALSSNRADLIRLLDGDPTYATLKWQGSAGFEMPTKAPKLTILKAQYGHEGKWADVTKLVSGAVRDGALELHVDNALAGDPAPGEGKLLKVAYEANGVIRQSETPENGDLLLDPMGVERRFKLHPAANSSDLSFTCTFSPNPVAKTLPSPDETLAASGKHWPAFWKSGGAIDLSGSKDPRWPELERRIVLSQYLMAVNEAGSYPPQESGLVNNGWFGRFHMEMFWWHETHWALWNRWTELDRSMGLYSKLLPEAMARAKSEGYLGARWPKCIGPDGREWPHVIHSLLLWQQPHPIFFAELDYRAHPTRATLERWRPIVEATADFLASYAFWDVKTNRYVLGPPLVVVSENTDPKTTMNPAFELGYWRFGLRTAQEWRTRLALPPKAEWEKVLKGLSPIPQQDGLYVLHEGVQDMWTKWNFEHPALTGAYGLLPGDGVDPAAMKRTLDKVDATWDFNHTWGWDFPMLAMCAARVGEPERAIDFLMTQAPGFQFDERGLATGGPFPYFPSNGGLLYAVAMMAKGWDGAPKRTAPGFPAGDHWKVRSEGLATAP